MPRGLSPNHCNQIERTNTIPEECQFLNPTLHFCPHWNDLLIDDTDPEYEICPCPKDEYER
jgi:hypothetical protein